MSKIKQHLKVLTLTNTFALGAMAITNYLINSSAILKNILKSHSDEYYKSSLGKIYYQKTGSGSPVLLVHDCVPCSSAYEWSMIIDKLSKQHTVYTIDLLGCGRSDKPGITYTNYVYVQLINHFIRDIIKEPTNVVTSGISSSFAAMGAYAEPDLYQKLLFINPCSIKKMKQEPIEKSAILKLLLNIPVLGTTIYNLEYNHQNIEYILTEQLLYNPFHMTQKLADAYYEAAHYHNSNGKYLQASLDGHFLYTDLQRVLPEIENDIKILYGEKSDKMDQIAEGYRSLNAYITSTSIYETKALPHIEASAETAVHILSFLDDEK